ncbi:MAG TPA: O-antigen ligase family protein [Pseudonocardiaceae bacterium]|nr:O-antigen ligase family protein [Pseudonocardiaceae bacterium]
MPATELTGVRGSQLGGSAARLLLLAAVSAGAAAQGGFHPAGRTVVAAFLVAALVAALVPWPPSRAELRRGPVLAAGAFAGGALLLGVARGEAVDEVPRVLLLGGICAVLLVCHRLDRNERELLLAGLLAVGTIAAAAGWAGVVWHLGPLALPDQGLWRAAGMLTYANANAALLVPLALVALALLAARPRSVALVLVATGLLIGAGATLSRAGAAGLLVGLLLLTVLAGAAATLRAVAGPIAGAVVAMAGLLPVLPETATPGPAPTVAALAALAAGLGLAWLVSRMPGRAMAASALAGTALLAAVAGGLAAAGATPAPVSEAVHQVGTARFNLASGDRSGATAVALRLIADSPLTGVGAGPDATVLRWTGANGELRVQRYVHNEYLQVTLELGAIGAALLIVLLGALASTVRRGRANAPSKAAWIGVAAALIALAVHSAFDFIWHLPVIPLTAAALAGVLTAPIVRPSVPPLAAIASEPPEKGTSE